jgi:dipeptidyl aminopeptidase/acylaminoacyl peptidase
MLPDGKHYLYLAMHHDSSKAANDAVYFASLDGKENRLVLHSQANAFYADGFLLFARGDALLAQPFDPDKGVLSGQPQPIATGVVNDLATWHISASASRDGMLVFGTGTAGEVQLLWLDRTGKTIGTVADKVTGLQMARVSPQGDRVALQIDAGMNDVWVQDLVRGVRTRLTFGPVANINPVWSPDGKWIAYSSRRDGGKFVLYRKLADGSGSEEALLQVPETFVNASDWTRDGKLIYFTGPLGGPFQLWELPLQGDRKPKLLLQSGAGGHVSPDGRWLAYASNESGTSEIYVVPFDGGPGKWQVSANGGIMPRWSHDGKQLYFMDRAYTIFTVPLKDAGATLQFGAAQTLAGNTFAAQAFYDVSPDGNKILLERVTQQINQSITVVTNFTAGLKK